MSLPEQLEALKLQSEGLTRAQIAERMGLTARQVKSRLAAARRDPAIQEAMTHIGTGMEPSTVWIKDDKYSIMLRPTPADTDMLADISDAFNDIKAADPIMPPGSVDDDLLTMYPLFDVHFGMLSWGEETGQDYDMALARSDLHTSLEKTLAITPHSKEALIIVGGDFFHADDARAETPASKHKLDVDGRHPKVLELGVELLVTVCERLLERHESVTVRVLRGNHDPHSHIVLTVALSQRYRNEPRLSVDMGKQDLFTMRWGDCLIAAHHGDRSKPERLALFIADNCPYWSDTYHRHVFTGHIHHHSAKDLGAIQWESLRAFCPPDAFAAGHHYASRRQMQSVTFHRRDGVVLRAYDPVRR